MSHRNLAQRAERNVDKMLLKKISKRWDEITYPFLNFNGATVEVKEWISNFILHFTGQTKNKQTKISQALLIGV